MVSGDLQGSVRSKKGKGERQTRGRVHLNLAPWKSLRVKGTSLKEKERGVPSLPICHGSWAFPREIGTSRGFQLCSFVGKAAPVGWGQLSEDSSQVQIVTSEAQRSWEGAHKTWKGCLSLKAWEMEGRKDGGREREREGRKERERMIMAVGV